MLTLIFVAALVLYFGVSERPSIQAVNSEGKILSQAIPDYATDQSPRFLVDSDNIVSESARRSAEHEFKATNGSLVVFVEDNKGNDTGLKPTIESSGTKNDQFYIAIPSGNFFVPGVLKLKVILSQDSNRAILEKQFRWSAISINYLQSTYAPGDKAELGVAVVDDSGQLICNAKTTVTITAPNNKTTIFTTSETCKDEGAKKRTNYKVIYFPEAEGQHKVEVSVETNEGPRQRESNFLVTDRAAITVVHKDPESLIFSSSEKTVTMLIHTRRPLNSMVRLPIPNTFTIENISGGGKLIPSPTGEPRIVWPLILKGGETGTLTFTYRASDISPAIYQLGLLDIRNPEALIQSNIVGDLDSIFLDKHKWEIVASNFIVYQN